MEQKIIEIIAEYQDRDESEYTADQTFTDMGLDSLDLAELILQLEDALGADAARGALATGLVDGELEEELGHVDHAGVLVHDDEATRAHHAAAGGEVVVVDHGVA
jgi:acyl carrier protein